MSSQTLKHRYFYPTNLFVAKYDIIVPDFSYICQIKCLKCKLLHFIFKLLEERRKFKLRACSFLLCCTLFATTDETQYGTEALGKTLALWVLVNFFFNK